MAEKNFSSYLLHKEDLINYTYWSVVLFCFSCTFWLTASPFLSDGLSWNICIFWCCTAPLLRNIQRFRFLYELPGGTYFASEFKSASILGRKVMGDEIAQVKPLHVFFPSSKVNVENCSYVWRRLLHHYKLLSGVANYLLCDFCWLVSRFNYHSIIEQCIWEGLYV